MRAWRAHVDGVAVILLDRDDDPAEVIEAVLGAQFGLERVGDYKLLGAPGPARRPKRENDDGKK